jgi:hypothetical protein
MAITPTTPPKKTTQVKPVTTGIPSFENWSEGRTGFSKGELEELYSLTFGLTPEALKKLEGQTGIKATETLKPKEVAKPKVPPQEIKRPAQDLLITRMGYPKWWKDQGVAPINLSTAGNQTVVNGTTGSKTFVSAIVLTVSGETTVSFWFGQFGQSGLMNLGGENEPRGIVISMADSPAPCGDGGFAVYSSGAMISVGGFVVYYHVRDVIE